MDEIDAHLPGGGLALGALHEVAGSGFDAVHGAACTRFAAGIAARTKGSVLWILKDRDLYAPGLRQSGLADRRVVYVAAHTERDILACFEEGLRHGALGAVIAETERLPMTASRRLHLAAEATGSLAIAVRRGGRAAEFGQPNACVTRWRIASLPSVALPVPGVGRARWHLELLRCRGGMPADFYVEACDDRGRLAPCRLALPAVLGDRPVASGGWRARA
ncbi:protein imuA [Tanticharoenia sakaeratensis NBRC 103193]|uniref:Protein imuA n=2 Tax=Tanticharoenia TaxID=444052 RepID=A0A0D6MLD0_9PROT|nr:protein imuA [Tanticharoenia sakaeratensis NBRC 103193]GBQ24674.1 hypothetical protein AA103193_2817 [Tanticharoenia sakaeratensis NBRC 103193]